MVVSVYACPRARDSLARSLAGFWLAIYLASHHPSCWTGAEPIEWSSRGIVQLMMTLGGSIGCRLAQLIWGPTHRAAPGWFHNLLLLARDWGELCPLLCCLSIESYSSAV